MIFTHNYMVSGDMTHTALLWFNMSLNLKIFSDQLLSVNDLSIVINPCTITVVTRQQGGAAREFVKIILHQQMLRISNI